MLDTLRSIDHNIFYWFNGNLVNHYTWLDNLLKFLSVYGVWLIPLGLVIVWFWRPQGRKIYLSTYLVGFIAWNVFCRIIGLIVNRPRPFMDIVGSKELVFHVPSYSFPSDHATFLAAFFTYLYLLGYKKIGWVGWVFTLVIVLSRIIGGVHYPSDIIAGIALGVAVAWLFYRFRRYYERWIIRPLLKLANFIGLGQEI